MVALTDLLEEALGKTPKITASGAVSGGCIHDSRRLETDAGFFFLKQASLHQRSMLEAESAALKALAGTNTVRVPTVITEGEVDQKYVLILEWIDLQPLDQNSGSDLGEKLAALHSVASGSRFGWGRENFIGSTPQYNGWMDSWPDFFRENRLRPQFELAREKGYSLPSPEPLLAGIESFFPDGALPPPRPLHGDLWGGNAACDGREEPVIFDPAFYYGDPETDLAFTRFFGGFPESFYRRYREIVPQRPGWQIRETLYNLYHVLNHLNLFGAGYRSTATRMIEDLNASATKGVNS